MLATLAKVLSRPKPIPENLPKPPMMVPSYLLLDPVNVSLPNPLPFPQISTNPTNPLGRLVAGAGTLASEHRTPVGATVVIPSAVSPFSRTSIGKVTGVQTTESTVQSLPYGPGARPDSPRLFGGASFGG